MMCYRTVQYLTGAITGECGLVEFRREGEDVGLTHIGHIRLGIILEVGVTARVEEVAR